MNSIWKNRLYLLLWMSLGIVCILVGLGEVMPPLSSGQIDVPKLSVGTVYTQILTVKNWGPFPRQCVALYSSCSCSKIYPQSVRLPPFGTGTMTLSIAGRERGLQASEILLSYGGLFSHMTRLNIRANVQADYECLPAVLDLGASPINEETTEGTIVVRRFSEEAKRGRLEVEENKNIAAATASEDPDGTTRIRIRLKPTKWAGPFATNVVIRNGGNLSITVPVSVRYVGPVAAAPESFYVGGIKGDSTTLSRGRIYMRDQSPLDSSKFSVQTDASFVSARILSDGEIEVNVSQSDVRGQFEAHVSFYDSVAGDGVTIPIFGVIKG